MKDLRISLSLTTVNVIKIREMPSGDWTATVGSGGAADRRRGGVDDGLYLEQGAQGRSEAGLGPAGDAARSGPQDGVDLLASLDGPGGRAAVRHDQRLAAAAQQLLDHLGRERRRRVARVRWAEADPGEDAVHQDRADPVEEARIGHLLPGHQFDVRDRGRQRGDDLGRALDEHDPEVGVAQDLGLCRCEHAREDHDELLVPRRARSGCRLERNGLG